MAYSTIPKPSVHFNTKLYSGSNSYPLAITGVGFKPDWTWVKHRNGTSNHKTSDIVRGVTKALQPNDTDAEATDSGGITSFNSDGFTVGNHADYNSGGRTYASWNWLAGGSSGSSNTDGSLASTVSLNSTAGFSIVKWTNSTSNAVTVGHGLGAIPKVILLKQLTGTGNWHSYFDEADSSGNKYLVLNANSALSTNSAVYNGTRPTASVISLGNHSTNINSTMIAYCFKEIKGYSKFGSYTGNANTNGPFVYTGFSPAFVMVKATDATKSWYMLDNKRSTSGSNVVDDQLLADTSDSEFDGSNIDMLSNGFKFRGSGSGENGSGTNYTYMAFAAEPLVANVGAGIPATGR